MGPVRCNHCQIRRAKTDPADGYSTVMDQLEIASTQSAQELERQPPSPQSTGETFAQHTRIRIGRHGTCNDRVWTAPITTWAQTAFKIQRLRRVKNTVLIGLVSATRSSRDYFNRSIFLSFFLFACFLKEGGCYITMYHMLRCTKHQHVINILSHRPLYTLHFVHI